MEIIKAEFIEEKPFLPFCHGATIVECQDALISAWFAGDYEGHSESCICISRNEGNGWSPAINVAKGKLDEKNVACWNPVLFYPQHGPLLLFYKVGIMPSRWRGALISSNDGGITWSQPHLLPKGFYGPVRNKPIQLDNGDIICGSSEEHGRWSVHMEWTSDLGRTWHKTSPLNQETVHLIQPTILQFSSGTMQMLCRSAENYVFNSYSKDSGKTWGPVYKTMLPNPNSSVDAITLKDNRALLIYNHSDKLRCPLNIAISNDEGKSWQQVLEIENELDTNGYSYPAAIQTNDGKVHIAYSWKYQQIKHVVIDV